MNALPKYERLEEATTAMKAWNDEQLTHWNGINADRFWQAKRTSYEIEKMQYALSALGAHDERKEPA